jgi:hypothetical protein
MGRGVGGGARHKKINIYNEKKTNSGEIISTKSISFFQNNVDEIT